MRLSSSSTPTSAAELFIRRLYAITADYESGLSDQVRRLLELGIDRFGMDIGILARIEAGRYEVVEAIAPPGIDLESGQTFDLGGTYCSVTVEADGPVGFEHAAESPISRHPAYAAFKLEAYIGIPVYNAGSLYGTLNFSSPYPRERRFEDADTDTLRLMSRWVASEIHRRALEEQLREARRHHEELSRIDPLTELANRRGISEILDGLISRAHHDADPLSCALIDIDDFKSVNDGFGHETGDRVIRAIADTIRGCMRPTDVAARIGGDEFLAIWPGVGLDEAHTVAQRILREIHALRIESDKGEVVTPSVSIGVAETAAEDATVADLITSTQAMLRQGKVDGKNTVVVGDPAGTAV